MRNKFGVQMPRVTAGYRRAMQNLPVIAPTGPTAAQESEPREYLDMGRYLVDSGLFDWALEEMPRFGIKRVSEAHAPRMAMIILNQMQRGAAPREAEFFGIESFAAEDVATTDLNLPTKWALPLIRRIYPAIFDSPLFATQTMPGPTAYAFFMDFTRESDGSDFRVVNPMTFLIQGAVGSGVNTFTLKSSQNPDAVGLGAYQGAAGQSIKLGLGTGNVETLTINTIAVSGNVVTVTTTGNTAHTHNDGDIAYIPPVSALSEAAVPTKAKLALTRSSVTASKYTYGATWSTEAMEDARAQLSIDVESELVMALAAEIGRELFGLIINDILSGATAGTTHLPAMGATNVQDYRFLETGPLYAAEANIYQKRNHDADTILCGIDVAQTLAKQDLIHVTPADAYSTMAQFGVTHLGTFQGKFNLFKSQFLPANMAIMFQQPRDWLHAGYVFMPYIPLSPMPLVYAGYDSSTGNYQNKDEWTRNIRMRAGKLLTVGDEYALLIQN